MTETKLTGLISKLEEVLDELNQQAKEIATEEVEDIEDIDSKSTKYVLVHSGRILGGEKLLSKRGLFKAMVANEAAKRTLDELNDLFPKRELDSANNLVADEPYIKSLTQGYVSRNKYMETGVKSIDGFELRALGEWKEWKDSERTVPGNFPVLKKIASGLGYQIIELN